ncbi:MAG: hypothetical protein QW156_04785 [Candidatus Aenigmatarchaeota archaeon]
MEIVKKTKNISNIEWSQLRGLADIAIVDEIDLRRIGIEPYLYPYSESVEPRKDIRVIIPIYIQGQESNKEKRKWLLVDFH